MERQLERAGLEAALADGVLNGLQLLVHTPFGGPLGSCRLADLPAGAG